MQGEAEEKLLCVFYIYLHCKQHQQVDSHYFKQTVRELIHSFLFQSHFKINPLTRDWMDTRFTGLYLNLILIVRHGFSGNRFSETTLNKIRMSTKASL